MYASEKRTTKKVEEPKGRLEKAKAKVLEEEEGMAKVDGELQGVKDQIKAHLRQEEERKERRRRSAFVEEAGSSEEVGVRVEVGKRRKVAREGRFFLGGAGSGGRGLDVEKLIRQLRCLSEEDRGRCMRAYVEVSSHSDENSGGAATRVAPLIGESALTPCEEKTLRDLKLFQKCKDACFVFNLQSRWKRGGSAVLPAAAASVGSRKERSVHAAVATADLRVAATAYSGTHGSLAASASGDTAIVSVCNGSLAGGLICSTRR